MADLSPKLTPPPNGSALLRENLFGDKADGGEGDDDGELLKRREPTMLQKGRKLIAPASDGTKRYTVVFDLDETVVYARDGPLYARAYLKDLFRSIKDDFEVIVWTAGERDYAKCILEEINEDHTIQHLVYRHAKWFREEDYTKDLRQLGRDLNYTLMIENTPDCVRANPQNGIIVEDFEVLPETTEEESSPTASPAPTPPPPQQQQQQQQQTTTAVAELSDTTSAPAPAAPRPTIPEGDSGGAATPLRRRRTTDRTLFLLRELLQSLVRSGATVPSFLDSCELLSRQTVTGSDGNDIPIYHLGTRRRRKDAGVQRKQVKTNRDRAPTAAPEAQSATTTVADATVEATPPPPPPSATAGEAVPHVEDREPHARDCSDSNVEGDGGNSVTRPDSPA
ncbi:TFIIF-stimulated CTD phosphatase [Novymonas esmeraldas]|uniref:Mitochondrial import inner membrane translocase subunit TIM50 n=1 Tax=Novymonas esmeraldas TaxID=1808958 RepID=A0AAW0ERZ4_9TRYP